MQVIARLASPHFCVEIHSVQAWIVVDLSVRVQQEQYPLLMNIRLPKKANASFDRRLERWWLGGKYGPRKGIYCWSESGCLCCQAVWPGETAVWPAYELPYKKYKKLGPRAASCMFHKIEQWYSAHGHNQSALAVRQLMTELEL